MPTILIALFGCNLLLLAFNAGVMWTKVSSLNNTITRITNELASLRDSFMYVSGQLSITHNITMKEKERHG